MWLDLTRIQNVQRKAIRSSAFLFTRYPQSVLSPAGIVLYLKSGAPSRDFPQQQIFIVWRELARLDASFQLVEDHTH